MTIFVFAMLMFRAFTYNTFNDRIGAEYRYIAESIINGNGFSNPFPLISNKVSVPTSWASAGYVLYYALILKMTGSDIQAAYWVLLFFKIIFLTISIYLLLTLKNDKFYQIITFAIFFFFAFMMTYEGTHDISPNILLATISIYILYRISQDTKLSNSYSIYLIFLAILLPLFNLAYAMVYFGFLVIYLYKNVKPQMRNVMIISLTLVPLIFCLWGLRNSMSLGKFMPFKSNLWFEFHMSNIESHNGLLGKSYFTKFHPYQNQELTRQYIDLGEVTFLKYYQDKSIEYLKSNPYDYVRKVMNRALNAFLFTENFDDVFEIRKDMNSTDKGILEKENLIINGLWHVNEKSDEDLNVILSRLHEPERIYQEIEEIKRIRNFNKYYPGSILAKVSISLMTFIPFFIMISSLLVKSIRTDRLFQITTITYLCSIGIYILISHYERYQFFHIAQFTIMIGLSGSYVIDLFVNRQKRMPEKITSVEQV